MVTNYPFSVILDVENNPYLKSRGQSYLPYSKENAGEEIINKIREAAQHVQIVYEQQKNAYNAFNNILTSLGNGTTLEDIFKQQYDLFKQLNDEEVDPRLEIEEIASEQEEYIEKLKREQAEFHRNFLATVDKVAAATTVKELKAYKTKLSENASKLERLLHDAVETFRNKDTIRRMKKIKENKAGVIKIEHTGEKLKVTFDKNRSKKSQQNSAYLDAIKRYHAALAAIKSSGAGARFAQSKTFRTEQAALWQEYANSRKDLERTLTDIYSRESIRSIYRYVRELVFGNGNPKPLTIMTQNRGEALVQAAAFSFEETAAIQFQQAISAALQQNGSAKAYILDVPLRVQFSKLPLAQEKNLALTELYALRDEINLKLDGFFRSHRVLDKVDSYVSVDFQQGDSYVLAFSNKLYHDLSRLTVVGSKTNSLLTEEGESFNKKATNLVNTYDLLAQAGAIADDFMFAVLNGSSASGLNQNINESSLEKWLTSFIYEIAFNPASFIQDMEKTIRENLNQSNIIYIFNAGSRIEPIYKILEKLLMFLMNTEMNLQSCVQTKIQFDKSNGQVLLDEVDKIHPPETNKYGHAKYPVQAWQYVATNVARNTLISVYLDLLTLQS